MLHFIRRKMENTHRNYSEGIRRYFFACRDKQDASRRPSDQKIVQRPRTQRIPGFATLVSAAAGTILALAALGGCTEAPVTERPQLILMSEQQASEMGQMAYRQIVQEKGASSNRSYQGKVEEIGRRIVRAAGEPADWEFTVIEDDKPNAFALPGGKVGVHTGLFNVVKTDAQLAAVISHEIAHVTARHPSERMSQQVLTQAGLVAIGAATDSQNLAPILAQAATLGVLLPFSRSQEAEADEIGLHYMAKAGYDPRAAIEVWQAFMKLDGERPPEFLSTHPAPANRIERMRKLMPEVLPIYRKNAK
jgi:predicted Zn-dependent protease